MLAADRAELAIGNEEHVTLFAVDVVNLKQLRPLAALTRPDLGCATEAVTGQNARPRLSPLRCRSRAPALIGLFELARMMGTSVEQIDRTYGHLLPDSIDRARTALDSFSAIDTERKAHDGN